MSVPWEIARPLIEEAKAALRALEALRADEGASAGEKTRRDPQGSSSSARSVNDDRRSDREEWEAASAPPDRDMPDPNYGDDLAYAEYWEMM